MFGLNWNSIAGNWRTSLMGLIKGVVVGVIVQHLPLGDAVGGAVINFLHSMFGTVAVAAPFVIGGVLQKDAAVGSKAE